MTDKGHHTGFLDQDEPAQKSELPFAKTDKHELDISSDFVVNRYAAFTEENSLFTATKTEPILGPNLQSSLSAILELHRGLRGLLLMPLCLQLYTGCDSLQGQL